MNEPRNPFAVSDTDAVLSAFTMIWGDLFDEVWVIGDDQWHAHHRDASPGENLAAPTPDQLNALMRAEWLRRGGERG